MTRSDLFDSNKIKRLLIKTISIPPTPPTTQFRAGTVPNTVRVGERFSKGRVEEAVVVEIRVVLVSPGPALTPGLVLDISR